MEVTKRFGGKADTVLVRLVSFSPPVFSIAPIKNFYKLIKYLQFVHIQFMFILYHGNRERGEKYLRIRISLDSEETKAVINYEVTPKAARDVINILDKVFVVQTSEEGDILDIKLTGVKENEKKNDSQKNESDEGYFYGCVSG